MSGPLGTMARMGSTNGETGAWGRVYKMGLPRQLFRQGHFPYPA